MKEFAMALWAMTASHHQLPMAPKEPIAVVQNAWPRQPAPESREQEQVALRNALERLARCSTGKLVHDRQSGFYIPETAPNCK